MEIVLNIGLVLAVFGFARKLNLAEAPAYGAAFLGAVFVAELPQIYVAFPMVKAWIEPLLYAVGVFVGAFGGKEVTTAVSAKLAEHFVK